MTLTHILTAAMWASVIALDITACGPFMLSQPLVAGPLFGYLMGNIVIGLIIGGVMQLLWMDLSPVGVGIPYDATAATILAVYWASLPGNTSLSQMALALAIATPFGFLFRWLDQAARRLNTRIMQKAMGFPDERLSWGLWLGTGAGILWSWARYIVAYTVAFAAGEALLRRLAYVPRMTTLDQGLTLALILLPVAGLGVTLELLLSDDPEGRWSKHRAKQPKKELA